MMQRIFKVAIIFLAPVLVLASDLFFSEYVEGSSNNKAFEIYNPTDATVDLSHYTIKQANNGSGWGCYTPQGGTPTADTRYELPLSGTLNAGDVYIIYNKSASTAVTSVGDLGFNYNSTPNGGVGDNVPSFNGDDALGLFKDGVLIDVIGAPTTDPGTGWAVAGTSNATVDHTIVRKATVSQGNTDWAASAGTSADDSEWMVYSIDTFTYLNYHLYQGGANIAPVASAGVDRVERFDVNVVLDGSGSLDPDGSITNYSWTQLAGTAVSLSATNQAIVTFTSTTEVAELVFELVVTDNESAVGKDTVTIYVDPSPIIISEYVEGSSKNKYLELYNASDAAIDLTTAGYDLRKATNGSGVFTNDFKDWGDKNVLASGGVIVIAEFGATLYTNADISMTVDYTVMSFNGNDAVGLFRNGLLVDLVGNPKSDAYIIQDQTLRRKNTVVWGNSAYDPSEWQSYSTDNVDGLGTHNTNPNAPLISNVVYSPDFVTSADEIEVSATIQPVVGTISSAKVIFGSGGILLNQADMWLESGDLWKGIVPAQAGNLVLEFKISASDNSSPANSVESPVFLLIVANATPTPIANIHENFTAYDGKIETVRGVVTIGNGLLQSGKTSVYIQDQSGRGLNLYDVANYPGINRGDELLVVGTVTKYFTTVEMTDFVYKTLGTGKELPAARTVSIAEANDAAWEGTLIQFNGLISESATVGAGQNIKVCSGLDTTVVRIPTTTGIDVGAYPVGSAFWFMGVGSKYSATFQTIVAYAVDIWPAVGVTQNKNSSYQFALEHAYPNPFNAATQLTWHLSSAGKYEVAVYNMVGQKVKVIASGFGKPGQYQKTWLAEGFPTGIYFVQLTTDKHRFTQKLVLVK